MAAQSADRRLDAWVIAAILVVMAYFALLGASRATDHAFVATLAGLLMLVQVIGRGPTGDVASKYENGVIKAGVAASMFWGIAGFLVAFAGACGSRRAWSGGGRRPRDSRRGD
jgi:hypothetical protein